MQRYFTCILLVAVLAIGVYSGFFLAKATEFEQSYPPVSADTAIDLRSFVVFAKGQHQWYVDHPDKCHEWSGDSEWNSKVVDYYDEIEELLR